MRLTPSALAEILPPGSGDWEPVLGGESGAAVLRERGQGCYAKVVPSERIIELAAERERTVWINDTDIPSARVLDWRETGAGACLITQAVPGVPANELDPASLRLAWPSVVGAVRALHGLATELCPFDRGLASMMSLAQATVREARVVVAYLPMALQHTPPTQILRQIEAELPLRLVDERDDLVVCHGDLCLSNILVDPSTGQVRAFIDMDRLGTADPYGDIALLLATARETWTDEAMASRADQQFCQLYGTELDGDRQDFYLRLDPLTW